MQASDASKSGGSTRFPEPFGAGGTIALAAGVGEKMGERVCGEQESLHLSQGPLSHQGVISKTGVALS